MENYIKCVALGQYEFMVPIDYILTLILSCLVHHGASKLFHSVELHVELDQYTLTHVTSPFLSVPQVGICRRNAICLLMCLVVSCGSAKQVFISKVRNKQ